MNGKEFSVPRPVLTYEAYAGDLKHFKAENRPLWTNCLLYAAELRDVIDEKRLFSLVSDGCFSLFADEGLYYNFYAYLRMDAKIPPPRLRKPAVARLPYQQRKPPAQLSEQRKQLTEAGFRPLPKAYQIVCSPAEQKLEIERQYAEYADRFQNGPFRPEFFNGETADFEEILLLWRENLSEYDIPFFSDGDMKRMAEEHEIPLIRDLSSGKIAAATHVSYRGKTGEIAHVCTHKAYRGKGMGAWLLFMALRAALEHNCNKVYEYIHEDNTVSWNLHNKVFAKSGLLIESYLLPASHEEL